MSLIPSTSRKKSGPKLPKAPNPTDLISQQAGANRVNLFTPYGSSVYSQGPEGQWNQNVSLSPEQESLYKSLMGDIGGDSSQNRIEQAVYGRTKALLDPRYQQQENDLISRLANQGIAQGSEAYNKEFENFNRSRNEAYSAADKDAIMQGFNVRQQLFNQLGQIMGGSPIQSNVPLDVQGPYGMQIAADTARGMGAYQANQNAWQNLMNLGGLGVMAKYAGVFSDRELKTDIRPVGHTRSGLTLYSFKYLWSEQECIGVMADEVEQAFPDAVFEVEGFKMVDYGRIH